LKKSQVRLYHCVQVLSGPGFVRTPLFCMQYALESMESKWNELNSTEELHLFISFHFSHFKHKIGVLRELLCRWRRRQR